MMITYTVYYVCAPPSSLLSSSTACRVFLFNNIRIHARHVWITFFSIVAYANNRAHSIKSQ